MRIVTTEQGKTISIGPYVPAIVIVLEQEAEVVAYCCGHTEAEFNQYLSRLIDERGGEWGEALLRVLGHELDNGSDSV